MEILGNKKCLLYSTVVGIILFFSCVFWTNLEASCNVEVVPFITISKGALSGIQMRSFLTIRTDQEWQYIWNKHYSSLGISPSIPPIDFSKEMVIPIFQGSKPTGGFGVEILRVEKCGERLLVFYKEIIPPRGSMVPQVLTQPYHMIKLQRTEGEVIFQHQRH